MSLRKAEIILATVSEDKKAIAIRVMFLDNGEFQVVYAPPEAFDLSSYQNQKDGLEEIANLLSGRIYNEKEKKWETVAGRPPMKINIDM